MFSAFLLGFREKCPPLPPPSTPQLPPCVTEELSRDFEQRFSTPQRAEGNDTQAIVWEWWREQGKRRSPSCLGYTPLKFNMEPENQPLEKETPFGNHDFQVPCWTLGVYIGDELLHSYMVSIINHYDRIPIKQPGFNGKVSEGPYFSWLTCESKGVNLLFDSTYSVNVCLGNWATSPQKEMIV